MPNQRCSVRSEVDDEVDSVVGSSEPVSGDSTKSLKMLPRRASNAQ